MSRISLQDWLEEAITDPHELHEKKCTRLLLMQDKGSDRLEEVQGTKIDLAKKPREVAELTKLYERWAMAQAQDAAGIQQFVLVAFYGEEKEPGSTYQFKVIDGRIRNGNNTIMSETADSKGLLGQLMKHNEANQGIISRMSEKIAETNVNLNHELNAAYDIIRKMMIERIELEHNKKLEYLKMEQQIQLQKRIMDNAPALINAISGSEIMPQSSVDTNIIENLARAIPKETMQMMLASGMIPKEQAAALLARFNQVIDQDKKVAEAVKSLPMATNDPMQEVNHDKA